MCLQSITGGNSFKDVQCVLSEFRKSKDLFELTLVDGAFSCSGYVKSNLFSFEQIKDFRGKVILISGLHEPGLLGVVPEKLKIKNIELKECQKELVSMIPHIQSDRLDSYVEKIMKYVSFVGREVPAYRQLLEVYFTEENIVHMKTMPATHTRQGSPLGGMLHATAAVTEMAYSLAMKYIDCANNLYSFNDKRTINWDLLLTGALLHLAGNMLYFEAEVPHRKRSEGVEQGFCICRHQFILELLMRNGIQMNAEDLSALLGVMGRLNEQHEGVKKCRQESSFLYSAYVSFLEMDMMDADVVQMLKGMSEHPGEGDFETYGFSSNLGCYVSKAEILRKADILGIGKSQQVSTTNTEEVSA